jgi:DNA-binding NarL/FixJ family response regulator
LIGEASNGIEAIQQIKQSHPHVALLDIDMPVMDGIDTAKVLQKDYPNIHVLFLSAYADRFFIQLVCATGCSGYIVKDQAALLLVRTLRSLFQSGK